MVPPLVERALALTEELGFERSCTEDVGRLLHLLAASRGRERVAEIGTGTGVGAAWIVSALPPETPFFTVELDAGRAGAATALFANDRNVHVLAGDWRHSRRAESRCSTTSPPTVRDLIRYVTSGSAIPSSWRSRS